MSAMMMYVLIKPGFELLGFFCFDHFPLCAFFSYPRYSVTLNRIIKFVTFMSVTPSVFGSGLYDFK